MADTDNTESGAGDETPKKSKLKLIIIGVVALALAGGGGGYFFLAKGKKKEEHAETPAAAKPLSFVEVPKIMVNLAGQPGERVQYLKAKLVLEVKEAEREATAALVQAEMQNAFKLDVPLLAEVSYGKDWASAK